MFKPAKYEVVCKEGLDFFGLESECDSVFFGVKEVYFFILSSFFLPERSDGVVAWLRILK